MQAAAGVMFKEGDNYVDRGPSYLEERKRSSGPGIKQQYTKEEYMGKFGSQSDFTHRG